MKAIGDKIRAFLIKMFNELHDEPRKISAAIVATTALSQLALSQFHIEALVRVRLTVDTVGATNYTAGMPSIGIGMFQFLFLLAGLVAIFNTIRAHTRKQQLAAIGAILTTVAMGAVFHLKMVNPDNFVALEDIAKSVNLLWIGYAGYAVGLGFILYRLIVKKGV